MLDERSAQNISKNIEFCYCYSVTQLYPTLCDLWAAAWTAAHQASLSFTISQSLLKLMSIELVMLSNHLILCHLLLLLHSLFPSIWAFSCESALPIRWPKYWSFSFRISLPMNIWDWFPFRLTGWYPCSPRDSQESSPIPQFKSISSSVFSFLCGPAFTSIDDYWKNHSFDYMDLCWQSDILVFNTLSRFAIVFLPEAIVFWFHGCSHHPQWF